ncbi:MAG TPA: exosortase E/protease, VPEID-CTERM system [Verrucomicrobiae bacterium]|nr:exosortase E/protease, VPEID-CTERM system [Verrucomicrobiae bacterium]
MEWTATSRWRVRVLTGFAILVTEAFCIRATGIKQDIGAAGSILTGGNQFFRLIVLPFLLTLLYAALTRLRGAPYRSDPPRHLPRRWMLAHGLCFTAFLVLTFLLGINGPARSSAITAGLWFCVGMATAVTGILAAFDPSMISKSARGAALTVVAFSLASLIGMPLVERSWNYDSNITVNAATALLQHVGFTDVSAVGKRIVTPHFKVDITPACSGYEGIGLFLIFAITWLAWFHKEYRFPAALLVLPIGTAISWGLNVVRIAGYVVIGYYGHKEIAMGGFHSWAGLIAFTMLALAFCSVSPRVPGIGSLPAPAEAKAIESTTDPIVYYLLPFLAVQAASMLSRAASGGMEWLYPLRVLAAAAAFWPYRKRYAAIDWGRASWFAAGIGVITAALWVGTSWRFPFNPGAATYLAQVSIPGRVAWLAFRVIGGVLAAPFVEELAFRGFLMRRIAGADFESVDPRRCGWLAIAISSAVFGLLHGPRFVEGTAAGALYAYAYSKTGKLGSAILAHTVTNLALAIVVAATGDWRFW